jgi:uncharacterized protein
MSIPSIDVRELIGTPGGTRQVEVAGTIQGLGSEVARVREDAPVECRLVLRSIVEGVFVTGEIDGTMQLRCSRCLKEWEAPFEVEVRELYVSDPEPDTDDYPLEPDGFIYPEQMARDVIGVELPFSPLCRPDCLGLCPVCGGDRSLGDCPGDHETIDPRWSELQGIAERLEELGTGQ